MRIQAATALYIKLGRGGAWERECIQGGTLRFGYREAPHEWCANGCWDKVQAEMTRFRGNARVATQDTRQIKHFYTAGPDVLWVTFYNHSLWWCFSDPDVAALPDNTKTRIAKGGWKSEDALERPLALSSLSGRLLTMQGFRGTICRVTEHDYLLRRLNGEDREEVSAAKVAVQTLQETLERVIQTLTWQDFELLVDLIFRQAGWQRVSPIGGTTRSLDIELISPISAERYGVQIKSQANLQLFESYKQERLTDIQGFARFYFAVHTPSQDLAELDIGEDDAVRLLRPADIARLATQYGLAGWIIDKAG